MYSTSSLPASSLLDLRTRRVPPLDQPVWIVGIDQTRFEPPMLLEHVCEARDPDLEGCVDLTVWTKGHRPHQMTGLIVDPDAVISLGFES